MFVAARRRRIWARRGGRAQNSPGRTLGRRWRWAAGGRLGVSVEYVAMLQSILKSLIMVRGEERAKLEYDPKSETVSRRRHVVTSLRLTLHIIHHGAG